MEGIYVGRITRSKVDKGSADLYFVDHRQDIHYFENVIEYDDTAYCLVPSDDILINNDELLKLRDEVKRLTDECKEWDAKCNDWKARYSKANNELFQKGLAYGTLEGAYKNEKIAGEILLKDRDVLKERVEKLEAELTEIKTTRTLCEEAYIAGVEKGCESLREERDQWKRRWNSVVTDIGESLNANGITFVLKEIHGDGNWDVVIDIPELNEAKAKVAELEKKLADATSKETYWRDRKEEEEDYHHYWLHTYDRVVKQAADKGIHIDIRCTDETCNAGVVVVDNVKAEELEKRVVALEKTNKNLDQKLGAADNALEYWNNTYNDIVIAGKNVGVKIDIKGKKPDNNAGFVYVTNEMALDLAYKFNNVRQKHDKKWQAMCDALKAKGVEVIYMGEEDGKPIVDVKIPKLDELHKESDARAHQIDILGKDYIIRGQIISDLKKELEELKSKIGTCTLASCADGRIEFIYTYMDGHNETAHINCLCKNHVAVDAESISCGTIPKCKSCAHYVSGSRMADIWCRKPTSKEGPGTVRRLSTEEAESPACSDYKARKE